MNIAGKLEKEFEEIAEIVADDLKEMVEHNQKLHTVPVPVTLLGQILTRLTKIESTLTNMEEKLDTANAELDQLEIAETDLASQAHAAVDLITKESSNIVDLVAQVKALTDAAASGSAIQPSTVNALNTRIQKSLAAIQAQAATLKSALPPPVPAPNITSSLTASGQVGAAFSYQVGTDGPVTGGGAAGLPDGLSFSSDLGSISGTPTVAGTFSVQLSVSNAGGSTTSTLVITVAEAAAPVDSTPSSPQAAGTSSSS